MQIRTVSALLVWIVVIMLLLNAYFRETWLFFLAIVLAAIAVLAYFSPNLKRHYGSTGNK